MKRTIKFRGKRVDTGEFVYGDLAHNFGEMFVGNRKVDPDSVAQLVGYDKDGREVYETDYIIEYNGDVARVKYYDNPAYIKLCKLYEATS